MGIRQWLEPPRRVLGMFLAITLVPAAALAWLGWRMLEQDRALESQRAQERLEHAADRVSAALERSLAALEEQLESRSPVPANAVVIVGRGNEIEARPPGRLLYYPVLPVAAGAASSWFAAGEDAEFRESSPGKAAEVFRKLAESPEPAVRAGALLRLARNLRKAGKQREALEAYQALIGMNEMPVTGLPAELVAREARCRVWEESGAKEELRGEAELLWRDLHAARWRVLRSTYEFHAEQLRRWIGASPETDSLVLAGGVEWVWERWRAEPSTKGRRFLAIGDRPVLAVWQSTPERLSALVGGPELAASWWARAAGDSTVKCALTDADGRVMMGRLDTSAKHQTVRAAAATKLPGTLHVAADSVGNGLAARRRILMAAGAAVAMLLLGGGYFVFRAVAREMAVARLQSDFVAAVSHEFRSPLTSIRSLSEMLARGRVPAEPERRRAYDVLVRESERLHKLVEGLLDFGRMQAGTAPYKLEPMDAATMVRELVAEFQEQVAEKGYRIELVAEPELPRIRADPEALARALWNLLDNAVKYSPESKTVEVGVAREGEQVAIHVRDQGIGIPASQKKEIFRKFVRGGNAPRVRGAGLGLAMVDHIVRAHGGQVKLESAPGQGSRFTLLLPGEQAG
jgi:signal transduction histidine kinase